MSLAETIASDTMSVNGSEINTPTTLRKGEQRIYRVSINVWPNVSVGLVTLYTGKQSLVITISLSESLLIRRGLSSSHTSPQRVTYLSNEDAMLSNGGVIAVL